MLAAALMQLFTILRQAAKGQMVVWKEDALR